MAKYLAIVTYTAEGLKGLMAELPDNAAAAATAMSAAATGMVVNRMVPLLTADEVDRAASAVLAYDAPGS